MRSPWREQQQGGSLKRLAAVSQQAYEGEARELPPGPREYPRARACQRRVPQVQLLQIVPALRRVLQVLHKLQLHY